MFKRLLVPVVGSAAQEQTLEKAVALARTFASEVSLICVIDSFAFTGVGADLAYGQTEYLQAAQAEARASIDLAAGVFTAAGVPVSSSVVEGEAVYKCILSAARACQADLIVMGSHGRKGLEKWLLGSVAAQVLDNTHLPVLIVHE